MTRLLTSAALAASLLLACSSSTTGTTGGTIGSNGTTSASSGTTGASSTTSSSSGTTSGATTATTSGSSGTTSGSTPYCNGAELQSSSSVNLYVATYPESDDIRVGCDEAFDALSDGGANIAFPAMGGILDNNSYSTMAGLLTFFPAGCDDLGQDAGPVIAGTAITVPTGASTVAVARATQLDGGTIYGIVTYIESPYFDTTTGKSKDGTLYLQDLPDAGGPAAMSGIAVYIDDKYTTDAGTVGYPAAGLGRGSVVAISGLYWSPYGPSDSQDQYTYNSGSIVTVLGTQPLPAAVSLSATQIGNGGGAQYVGMRVTQTDAPDTVTDACPTVLQSN